MANDWASQLTDELATAAEHYAAAVQRLVSVCRERQIPADVIASLVLESASAIDGLEAFQKSIVATLGTSLRSGEADPGLEPVSNAPQAGTSVNENQFPVEQVIDIEQALESSDVDAAYVWPAGTASLTSSGVDLKGLKEEPLSPPNGDPWADLAIGESEKTPISPRKPGRLDLISDPPRDLFEEPASKPERIARHSLPPPLPVDLLDPASIDVNPSSLGEISVHESDPMDTPASDPRGLRVKVGVETKGKFATGLSHSLTGQRIVFEADGMQLERNDYCKIHFSLPHGFGEVAGEGIIAVLQSGTHGLRAELQFTELSPGAKAKVLAYLESRAV